MLPFSLARWRAALPYFVWAFAGVVVVAGAARYALISQIGEASPIGPLSWLDLGGESSLGAWWTSLLWSASALLCFLISRTDTSRWRLYWAALSVGSLLLSLDETVQLHEQFALPAMRLVGSAPGIWATGWVIAAVPIVLLCFGLLLPFMFHIRRRTSLKFLAAGAIFIIGSVGMEMVFGSAVTEWHVPSWAILLMVFIEETLEIAGVTIFLLALSDEFTNRVENPSTTLAGALR